MRPIFISGIGTGIGKTLVASVVAEALYADYWKPVQAGMEPETDSLRVKAMIGNSESVIHPETYIFSLPASPHISARKEHTKILLSRLVEDYDRMDKNRPLVIEGAGGLMVPLNEKEFVIDLVKLLDARLVLVSRNYLGSINHSLMTANICRSRGVDVAGWIFNDQYLDYAEEIAGWSGFPIIFSLPALEQISKHTIAELGKQFRASCRKVLLSGTGLAGE
jgi:dethiobiotin synthetase